MILVCDRCDSAQTLGKYTPGVLLHCVRCDHELYVPRRPRLDTMLALTLTGFIAFAISNMFPVVTLYAHGHVRSATLIAAVEAAADQGALGVAVISAVAAFVLPLMELCLYLWLIVPMRSAHIPRGFRSSLHALRGIRHWSMVEVFLLAVIISAVKLGGVATVTPGPGVFALFVLAVCVSILRTFDLRDLWAEADEHRR